MDAQTLESLTGFSEAFRRAFGDVTPPRADGGAAVTWFESALGPLVAAATDTGIALLEFSDVGRLEREIEMVRQRCGHTAVSGGHHHLDQLRAELDEYFAGRRRRFDVPLTYPGTPFQRRVWEALLQIPYGETLSYEHLAREIGASGAARAVGHANGQNPIAIVIPCHRVVNKGGKLGGYGGGLWRKRRLLDLELSHSGLFAASEDPAARRATV